MIIGLALVMMFVLDRFVNRSRLGRGIRAVAQNPDSAALMGVNKDRIISLVFLLGGLMAGIASVMYVIKVGATRYDDRFRDRHPGVRRGRARWHRQPAWRAARRARAGRRRELGRRGLGSQWQYAFGCVVLIVILMFRPTGLLGESLGRARA